MISGPKPGWDMSQTQSNNYPEGWQFAPEKLPSLDSENVVFQPSIFVSASREDFGGVFTPPKSQDLSVVVSGGLYNPYHPLGEPGNSMEFMFLCRIFTYFRLVQDWIFRVARDSSRDVAVD